jgi:hypothetical protein
VGKLRREAAIRILAATLIAGIALAAPEAAAQAISLRNLPQPGAFEVVNGGAEASLSTKVQVQRLFEGRWENEVTDLELVRTCNPPKTLDCITLGPGETLRPPPWNGLACASQCAASCRGNMSLPPGTFRFGISACSGDTSIYGPPFDMAASP